MPNNNNNKGWVEEHNVKLLAHDCNDPSSSSERVNLAMLKMTHTITHLSEIYLLSPTLFLSDQLATSPTLQQCLYVLHLRLC